MKRFYDRSDLGFALVCIGVYCAVMAPIRAALGDTSPVMLLMLAGAAAFLLTFIRKNALSERYGLVKWRGRAVDYLCFIPMLVITTTNLWGGVGMTYRGMEQVWAVLSMLLVNLSRIFVPCITEAQFSISGDNNFVAELWNGASDQSADRTGRNRFADPGDFGLFMGLSVQRSVLCLWELVDLYAGAWIDQCIFHVFICGRNECDALHDVNAGCRPAVWSIFAPKTCRAELRGIL